MPTPATALRRRVAQLLAVGFAGPTLDDELRLLLDHGVAGVILFSRNVQDPEQVARLVAEIKRYAGRPLYVAVDQEGGVVQRLRAGFTPVPSMRALGSTGEPDLARRLGELLGTELRAVGIDVDFAPVLDVDTNPKNPVIGARAFGADPGLVSRVGIALGQGLQAAGVAACGKHYPGHGDTELDSHWALPVVRHPRSRLELVEWAPFAAWARAGLASLMTAHVVYEAIDPGLPATMSKPLLGGLLRDQMGYDGLVFSDDLEMKAVFDHYGAGEAAVLGLAAGVDQFLVCHRAQVAHQVLDALEGAVEAGKVGMERLAEAERRTRRFLADWARPAEAPVLSQLCSAEARALITEIQTKAAQVMDLVADPTERGPRDE